VLDPNLAVQRALFQAITQANVILNGAMVPIYAYAPTSATAPYILVDQVSTVPVTIAHACKMWECIFQLTILTSFVETGDDVPSLEIQGRILDILDSQRLPIKGGYSMNPISIQLLRKASEYDQNTVNVLRYIRVKIQVY
jgi:hypothetical protein